LFAAALTALYSAAAFEEIVGINPKRVRSNTLHKFLPLSNRLSLGGLTLLSLGVGFFYQKQLSDAFQRYFQNQGSFKITLTPFYEDTVIGFSHVSQSLPLLFDIMPLAVGLVFTGIPRMNVKRFYIKNNFFYEVFYGLKGSGFNTNITKMVLWVSQTWARNKF
jgi:hypothetical protein